jgi:hypothetical protein
MAKAAGVAARFIAEALVLVVGKSRKTGCEEVKHYELQLDAIRGLN